MNCWHLFFKFLGYYYKEFNNQKNGDQIALQYAGSEAFHKAEIYKSKEGWKPVKENITLKAIKRYF